MNKKFLFITLCFLIILTGCSTATNNEANNQGGNDEITNNDPANLTESTIQLDAPGWPIYMQFVMDCNTSDNVVDGQRIAPDPGCDLWGANRYERPFNAQSQDQFYPDLDLLFMEIGFSGDWYYVRLGLDDHNPDNDTLPGIYGLEIDFDMDGRGDLLLLSKQPQESDGGAEWYFNNSEVWIDDDQDVGADTPRYADKPNDPDDTNGYDQMLPNLGQLWSRSNHKNEDFLEIEFAFKTDLLMDNSKFILTGWSFYQDSPAPAAFDLHDTYENQDAGDVYSTAPYYPAFKVSALDNTCGMLIGGAEDEDPSLCINDPETLWYIPTSEKQPGNGCPALSFDDWVAWVYSENPQFFPQPYSLLILYYEFYVFDTGCTPPPTHTPPPPGDCDPMSFEEWQIEWYAMYPEPLPYSYLLNLYEWYLDIETYLCSTPTPPPPPDDEDCEHMAFDDWKNWYYSIFPEYYPMSFETLLWLYDIYLNFETPICPTPTPPGDEECKHMSFEDWKDWYYSTNPSQFPQTNQEMSWLYGLYLKFEIPQCPPPPPDLCPPVSFEDWLPWWYYNHPDYYPSPHQILLWFYYNFLEYPECIEPPPTPTPTATRPPPPTWTPVPTSTSTQPPPPDDKCYNRSGQEIPCPTPSPTRPSGQP